MSANTQKISRGKKRSAARLAAVQGLYELELSGRNLVDIYQDFEARGATAHLEGEDIPAEKDLFMDIIRGVDAEKSALDERLNLILLEGRKVDSMEILMQAILRAGAYELMYRDDIDAALSISEYLSVTGAFYSGQEPGLVNGILDKLSKALKEESGLPEAE